MSSPFSDQYEADAWEGDSGLAQANQAYTFDSPALPAGVSLNQGVAGTTVKPYEDPVPGAVLNGDAFTTEMNPSDLSQLTKSNDALGPGLLTNARSAIGSASQSADTQGPEPLPPVASQPPSWFSGAGYGGGSYSGATYGDGAYKGGSYGNGSGSSGGGLFGFYGGGGGFFGGGGGGGGGGGSSSDGGSSSGGSYGSYDATGNASGPARWSLFGAPINPWTQTTSMSMSGAPPWDPNDPAGAAGQQAVSQAMNKSLSGWGSGGGGGSDTGDALTSPSDFPTQAEANYGNGFNDSVWSGIDGVSTVGQDEAAGNTDGAWSNLGGITTVAQDDASGANTPGPGFNSLGGSEGGSWAGNTAYMPKTGFESRGYDPVVGSNLIQDGDLYSDHPSLMAKFYSG